MTIVETNISNRLRELLAAEVGLPVIALKNDLRVDSLGLDSLALVELIVAVEQELNVRIDVGQLPEHLSSELRLDGLLAVIGQAASSVEVT